MSTCPGSLVVQLSPPGWLQSLRPQHGVTWRSFTMATSWFRRWAEEIRGWVKEAGFLGDDSTVTACHQKPVPLQLVAWCPHAFPPHPGTMLPVHHKKRVSDDNAEQSQQGPVPTQSHSHFTSVKAALASSGFYKSVLRVQHWSYQLIS